MQVEHRLPGISAVVDGKSKGVLDAELARERTHSHHQVAEQRLIPGSEFRPIDCIDGHLGLFGTHADYAGQVDKHLAELLATPA